MKKSLLTLITVTIAVTSYTTTMYGKKQISAVKKPNASSKNTNTNSTKTGSSAKASALQPSTTPTTSTASAAVQASAATQTPAQAALSQPVQPTETVMPQFSGTLATDQKVQAAVNQLVMDGQNAGLKDFATGVMNALVSYQSLPATLQADITQLFNAVNAALQTTQAMAAAGLPTSLTAAQMALMPTGATTVQNATGSTPTGTLDKTIAATAPSDSTKMATMNASEQAPADQSTGMPSIVIPANQSCLNGGKCTLDTTVSPNILTCFECPDSQGGYTATITYSVKSLQQNGYDVNTPPFFNGNVVYLNVPAF